MKGSNIKAILKAISKGIMAPNDLETGHSPIVDYELLADKYINRVTRESFTETEFTAMEQADQRTLRIVLIPSTIPIAESEEEIIM